MEESYGFFEKNQEAIDVFRLGYRNSSLTLEIIVEINFFQIATRMTIKLELRHIPRR